MMKKRTSFKEDLRKSLINHALVPLVLSIFVIIVAITVIGVCMVARKNIGVGSQFTEEFTTLVEEYSQEAETISERVSMPDFQEHISYRVNEIAKIYHFLNHQSIRGEFYLFDQNFELIFGTANDPVIEGYLKYHLKGNKNDEEFWKKSEFMYDNWNLRKKTAPSCIIFRRIGQGEEICGYGGFVISADYFKASQKDQDLAVIITNRFDRVFSEGAEKFCDDRGKLADEFRSNGVITKNHRWYYATVNRTLDDNVKIFAISDCTIFLQFIFLSSLIVLFLSVVMIYFIYISAGNIAVKKTDIMYELIGALEEMEHGNLDVELDIQSGDEFETMGNTFNMMSESIRDLISREQQLTKENTIATIQTLESQFNPHFLFNTLESVRYMIRADSKTAEKMIVNLSRLLRYSVQKGEKMVILGEEIEFADKYLQIMLCRYGEKLKYSIEVDEWLYEVEVPRMIAQPIVENSIKYGYGERKTLRIHIFSRIREQGIELLIEDDGRGIEEKLLNEIRENLQCNHNYSGHIGIHNVHRRLQLLYGEEYGVTIESVVGKGTTVKLYIPNLDRTGEIQFVAEDNDCRR